MSGYFVYHGSYQWVRLFVGGITILLITLGLSVAAVGSAAAQSTDTVVSTDGDRISDNISVTGDSIPNQDIATTSTGSLTGDVVSEDGEYLTGAEVVLVDAETEQTVAETTTGSQGSYVFTDVELGEYQVTATFEDETGSTTITDMAEGTNNADVVVGLSESAGVLTGDIVNADNQNLPGAEVTLVDAETEQTVAETTASSDGSYTFSDIEQGDYQVTATFDGESGSRTTTVTDGTTTADIVILGAELTGTLVGDIVNEDYESLPGAEVTLVDAETGQTVTEAIADEDGSYRFTDVTAGEYVVTATFEGETSSTAVTVRGGETAVADIAIAGVLEPTGTLTGDVVNEDNEHLAGAEVTVVDAETDQTVTEAIADEDGEYRFTDVEVGEYVVTAAFEGETSSTAVTVRGGETTVADIAIAGVLEPTGTLTGDVVNENNEYLAGAEVTLVDAETGQTVTETTANSDGSYTFSDIEQGDYQVTATFDGESGSRTTPVTDGTTTADIVIPGAELTGTLTGDVVNEDNEHLAGAEVTVVDAETDQTVTEAVADEDGSYRFTDVTAGEYVVTATFEGETSSTAVTIKRGETTVANIAIAGVLEPTGTLTGGVVNEDNEHLAGAEVTVVDAETDQTVTEAIADEDGSYRFTDVTAGEYVVTATFEGETSSTAATVRGGETTVADIAIAGVSEPPALVAPDGFPADDETYSAIASVGEPNEDGTFGAITLAQAMNKMASEGTIDGVYIGQIQFAQIIHWHTNQ